MSLYPRSKRSPDHRQYDQQRIQIHPIDLPHDEEEHMQIPSVIVVPQRTCRVANSMRERYQEISNVGVGVGRITSPSLSEGSKSSSKPWNVDMARKTYSTRRFRRPSGVRRTPPVMEEAAPPSLCYSPDNSCNASDGVAPELDGSWSKLIDDGYPSDEEKGFGGSGNNRRRSNGSGSPNSLGDYSFRGYERYVSSRASRYQRA